MNFSNLITNSFSSQTKEEEDEEASSNPESNGGFSIFSNSIGKQEDPKEEEESSSSSLFNPANIFSSFFTIRPIIQFSEEIKTEDKTCLNLIFSEENLKVLKDEVEHMSKCSDKIILNLIINSSTSKSSIISLFTQSSTLDVNSEINGLIETLKQEGICVSNIMKDLNDGEIKGSGQ